MSSNLERLIKILEEQLSLEKEQIDTDSELINDLGADSLDIVEIMMSVEEEFEFDPGLEFWENESLTVQNILDKIDEN